MRTCKICKEKYDPRDSIVAEWHEMRLCFLERKERIKKESD
jgi:hypothetical protein